MSSSQSHTPKPISSKTLIPVGLPASYIGSWAVVGLVSLGYLGLAATEPDGPPGLGTSAQQLAEAPNPTAATASEEKPIDQHEKKPKITILATKNAHPPSDALAQKPAPTVSAEAESEENSADRENVEKPAGDTDASRPPPVVIRPYGSQPITTRYISTEQILASRFYNQAPNPEPEAAEPEPEQTASKPQPASSPIVTGSIAIPPPPPRGPPRAAVQRAKPSPATNPAKTARIAPKTKPKNTQIAFGPAVVTPSVETPALAILLATGSSLESLRATWSRLKQRHSGALNNLNPRYIIERNPNAPDRRYTLLAGPVISATDVARVCSVLVSEGLNCRTRTYTGNSL